MNYAANTGKKSTFLERCVSSGKYCMLVLKSKSEEGPGEVVAAISFQIIPADTQYAEVPLAAVCSVYQHKGIGHLTYLEMRRRLHSVGVHSIFCWADEESEGVWLKQGFVSVGQVDTKGRARRLPIKADIRKALCFPGGSTLMISHLNKECSDNSAESLQPSSVLKSVHKPLIVSGYVPSSRTESTSSSGSSRLSHSEMPARLASTESELASTKSELVHMRGEVAELSQLVWSLISGQPLPSFSTSRNVQDRGSEIFKCY